MVRVILFILMATVLLPALAQRYRTVELKPIAKQGWSYYYELKKVASPLALQIPLLALDDEEVTRHYRGYSTLVNVAGSLSVVPVIYILTLPSSSYIDETTFWLVIGGTLIAQYSLLIASHSKLRKAIDRYNLLILQPSGHAPGIRLTYRF
jgi:hypothetical protein